MSTTKLSAGSIFRLLKETFSDWMEDNCLRLGAALSYYSVFSIAPLLVIAIGIAGLVFGQEAARGQIEKEMTKYIGAAAPAVQSMVASASKPSESTMATIFGVGLLLVGAGGVFGQLKDALNTIWEVKQKPGAGVMGFLKERFLSFGMVLVIGFLLLVSLLLTAGLAAFSGYFAHLLKLPAFVWGIIGFVGSFAVVTALFATIFKVLPDVKVQWRHVWIGAVVTALLFEIGKFGLAWYLGRESADSAYGAATSVVLLLLWVYYASLILFFGAEFTQVYASATGAEIEPAENAEPVTAERRAQEGLEPGKSSAIAGARPTDPDMPQPPREHLHPPATPRPPATPARPVSLNPLTIAAAAGLGAGFLLSWRQRHKAEPTDLIREGASELARRGSGALAELASAGAKKGRALFRGK